MQRLHVDYCGPFLGRFYALVAIDAYSRFPEVFITTSATASFSKRALRRLFAREGVPQVVVSDNGSHFTGEELQSWLRSVGCESIFTAPRHPCSNGLAENFVKSLKTAISTNAPTTEDELSQVVDTFLLQYRNATHASTGKSPATAFRGRNLRMPGSLDSTDVTFYRGNNSRPCRGMLIGRIGSRMFHVLDLEDGSVHRRHKDQFNIAAPTRADRDGPQVQPRVEVENMEETPQQQSEFGEDAEEEVPSTTPLEQLTQVDNSGVNPAASLGLRRSQRLRKPPGRYKDFIVQGRNVTV